QLRDDLYINTDYVKLIEADDKDKKKISFAISHDERAAGEVVQHGMVYSYGRTATPKCYWINSNFTSLDKAVSAYSKAASSKSAVVKLSDE
ncbi:MAG: hypothetical protein MJ180_02615, partial [Candidatus Gastranaerophilales bacterium]|nr:hypothetical protein [Candidatus Gastranaerophilales bacterium]